MSKIRRYVFYIFLFLLTIQSGFAAELGMNYYHETMMRDGFHYIERSLTQVQQDMQDIKKNTQYIKLYFNPLSNGNEAWVNQVNAIAKQTGLHTVIVANTEDRTLDDSNWDSYQRAVLSACKMFNAKADEFIVGNEITLHSPYSDDQIRDRVEVLITECKKQFTRGPVSYEAFWYEKDAWKNYNGKIYFNLYESLPKYKSNLAEMQAHFGSRAVIGEFGEDFTDESLKKNAAWQSDQLAARYRAIQETTTPVAYVFTYREPSSGGFGLLSPEGAPLPGFTALLDVQKESPRQGTKKPQVAPTPLPTSERIALKSLTLRCSALNLDCAKKLDVTSGSCRTIVLTTQKGEIKVLACEKDGNSVELYRQAEPTLIDYEVCLANGCISNDQGYLKFVPNQLSQQTPTKAQKPTLEALSLQASPQGKIVSDQTSGSCRNAKFSTSAGEITAKICDKGTHFELYRTSPASAATVCVKGACVGGLRGFNTIAF